MDPKVSLRWSRFDRFFTSAMIFTFVAYVCTHVFIVDRFDNHRLASLGVRVLDGAVQMFADDCSKSGDRLRNSRNRLQCVARLILIRELRSLSPEFARPRAQNVWQSRS